MAGHSQFKNIMHRKGKQDKIRAKNFSKLSREITVAASLSTVRLDQVREIVVQGATNALSSRR